AGGVVRGGAADRDAGRRAGAGRGAADRSPLRSGPGAGPGAAGPGARGRGAARARGGGRGRFAAAGGRRAASRDSAQGACRHPDPRPHSGGGPMKCPKCLYIGFETGDRCKNCGYDFSLLAMAEDAPAPPELPLRQREPALSGAALELPAFDDTWSGPVIDRFRDLPEADGPAMTLAGPAYLDDPLPVTPSTLPAAVAPPADMVAAAPPAERPALPLFAPDAVDDEPLVKLPVAPRPPLAVRRTPDTPRLRPTPTPARTLHEDAVLQFVEEPEDDVVPDDDDGAAEIRSAVAADAYDEPIATFRRPAFRTEAAVDASPFGRRLGA